MNTLFAILIFASLGLAVAGIILLLPEKGKKTSPAPQGPVSPDSMIRVRPAGPGKLRMSFPQEDRMPLEVMLQIAEVKEETDLDLLKDPGRPARDKQEAVDRLRALGYGIAYAPFPDGDTTVPLSDSGTSGDPATDRAAETASGSPDSGEGEVDPVTLRSIAETSPPSPLADAGFDDFLRDTEAILGTEESGIPGAGDERLREVAESQGLGGIQLPDTGLASEEGQDGMEAAVLMEFLAEGFKKGEVEARVARYAEELLNIRLLDAPWREEAFSPLDPSIPEKDSYQFDLSAGDLSAVPDPKPGKAGNRPVTTADLQSRGRWDLAWERLDLE